jgi:hypothetical protein
MLAPASVLVSWTLFAQTPSPLFIYTHAAERNNYLANAVIWRDPGPLTPEQIKMGPPSAVPAALVEAASGKPIECRYDRPGVELGGKTPKFSCRTSDGKSLRVKYYGTSHGNREVFAEVAATRLLWALGFDSDPVFPAVIQCLNCPADPWTGQGAQQNRRFIASYEPHYVGTIITSGKDPDQGWTFGELQAAIDSLPPGALRSRQRMHFDALSLLAVFIQHGDRKRSQQRLVCRGEIDVSKGDLHNVAGDETESAPIPVLFEQPSMKACVGESVVTLQDVGATLGGAGQFTGSSAKVHLKSWAGKEIFGAAPGGRSKDRGTECIGHINVSGSAGSGSGENPRISEAGRQFLATQFQRLTPEHVHAIFEAARVDQMGETHEWQDHSGKSYTGVDAWVAAFMDKVAQIERAHCGP